ncbi:hypothetical protein EMEDMD4_10187 [Sinorhizobium medicae]|uniref:Uncharacterized protein n=1 Tax=Sinorhizobium medicae TaxID=110321 RepID=A0A508WTN0_9HYPH|nr:hypothetical protein EMEDMD4_10187 [Sinorhizobium medicae]
MPASAATTLRPRELGRAGETRGLSAASVLVDHSAKAIQGRRGNERIAIHFSAYGQPVLG